MFVFAIFSILLATASAADNCYKDIEDACSTRPAVNDKEFLSNCNSIYGSIEKLQPDLQSYANTNVAASFYYLLMSAYHGSYTVNREGFKKLYRKLSDDSWNDAVDVIKYINKRGGKMDFNEPQRIENIAGSKARVIEQREFDSLGTALDIQKKLVKETQRLYHSAHELSKEDASLVHYLEEKFVHPQEDRVRNLAGYTQDFKHLLENNGDTPLSVFFFDEYLKESL